MAFHLALHVGLHAQHLLVVVFRQIVFGENCVDVYVAVIGQCALGLFGGFDAGGGSLGLFPLSA